ncbi:hypothetical protein ACHHYP_01955 [Achlya hypogyna]|uniref:Uncharacterized protein n=1 Tax=Achlya hypogyna TaxID=1202772 RepID=A0A1V9ZSR1_ACHHY|nr:hypothetical protein ACHHYP_01955 [Achlya hypogyna]
MKAEPCFPHVLVVSPQDNPADVTSMYVNDVTTLSHSLRVPPITSLTALWVGFLRKIRSLQFYVESGLRRDLYHARLLQYELDLFTEALAHSAKSTEKEPRPYVYITAPRSVLRVCSTEHRALLLQWCQALAAKKLAHVVWLTSPSDAIAEFVQEAKATTDPDICLLVRPQSECIDNSSATDKLGLLSARYGIEFSEADSDRITSSAGNWWVDLEAICVDIVSRMEGDTSLSLAVDDACSAFDADAKAALIQYLRLDVDVVTMDEKTDLLEKWAAFQAACGLSNETTQVLANPQALVKPKKPSLPDVRPVLASFAGSGVTGERKFWNLFALNWLQLQPNTPVAVGVVPCEAVDVLRGCAVVVRPVLSRLFRELWADDAVWTKVQELQQAMDAEELREQVRNYESEVEITARAYLKKRTEYELAWDAFDDAEKAQYRAELFLEELKLQAQRDHVARLKSVYAVEA